MSSSLNINTGTIVPIVINPEAIPVDSDSEADLEEIQCEVAAKQKRIEEAAQAKLLAACEHIEKKWKAKEEEVRKAEEVQKAEEVRKAEEEQGRKQKEEEDKLVREKTRKRQLEVSLSTSSQICRRLIDYRCFRNRRRRGRLSGWILTG